MASNLITLDARRGVRVPFVDTAGQFGPAGGIVIGVRAGNGSNSASFRNVPLPPGNDGLAFIDINGVTRVVTPGNDRTTLNQRQVLTLDEFRQYVAEKRGALGDLPDGVSAEQLLLFDLRGATPATVAGSPQFSAPSVVNTGATGSLALNPNAPQLIGSPIGPLTSERFAQLRQLGADMKEFPAALKRIADANGQIARLQEQAVQLSQQADAFAMIPFFQARTTALRTSADSLRNSARQLQASIVNDQNLVRRAQSASAANRSVAPQF